MESRELASLVRDILEEKGADRIQVLDVADMTSITDYFVFANGRNAQALHALAEDLIDKLDAAGTQCRRTEGLRDGRWIVLDYASVIVHLFHPDEREYYNIERLWTNGENELKKE